MTVQPGDLIADRFEIERFAASGGMGDVYRALDRATGRHVAVKVLRGGDAAAAERFAQEARLLATLSHPAIVAHLADGRTPDGTPFLAMEWLEGEDLATRLQHGSLTPREAIAVARQVSAALALLHARGVVHRDIKPANVFLVDFRADDVRLLDFGIARDVARAPLTLAGFVLGTPSYMAPEQAQAPARVDARADVFALGALLSRCLGHAPFPADVPPALAALVARMLAHDPAARPRDGAAVRLALRAVDEDPTLLAQPRPLSRRCRSPRRCPRSLR